MSDQSEGVSDQSDKGKVAPQLPPLAAHHLDTPGTTASSGPPGKASQGLESPVLPSSDPRPGRRSRGAWLAVGALALAVGLLVAVLLTRGDDGDRAEMVSSQRDDSGQTNGDAETAGNLLGADGVDEATSVVDDDFLHNATLPMDICGLDDLLPDDVRLVDGEVPGVAEGATITVDSTSVGDIDGNGAPDGLISLSCYGGGNAVWGEVVVFLDNGDLLGTVELDDRMTPMEEDVSIGSYRVGRIEDGEVEVLWTLHRQHDLAFDPNCCPGMWVTGRFQVDDGELVLASHSVDSAIETTRRLVDALNSGDADQARRWATPQAIETLQTWALSPEPLAAAVGPSPCTHQLGGGPEYCTVFRGSTLFSLTVVAQQDGTNETKHTYLVEEAVFAGDAH